MRDPGKTGVSKMISEIRKLVGNQGFAKMMGLNNSVTLAFVIDTTGSMSDEIRQVKELVTRIVNTKRSSVVHYILSPFNDYSADFISKGLFYLFLAHQLSQKPLKYLKIILTIILGFVRILKFQCIT